MKEKRPSRSPPSTLSSRKRGANEASFMNAETGVSRSPVMSKGGCNLYSSNGRGQQKTHPGVIRRWVAGAVRGLESREKRLTVSPLRYEVRHHQRRELLTGRCDIRQRVSPWDARHVKRPLPQAHRFERSASAPFG